MRARAVVAVWSAAALLLAVSTAASHGAVHTAVVVGRGEVDVVPDESEVRITLFAHGDEYASGAVSEVSSALPVLLDALVEAGIPADDIQTSSMRVFVENEGPTPPPWETQNDPVLFQSKERFRAEHVLQAVIRAADADLLGAVFDISSGVGGALLEFDGPYNGLGAGAALDASASARDIAVSEAKAKATQYAEAFNRTLGEVLSVSETAPCGGSSGVYGGFVEGVPTARHANTAPISNVTVSATVYVTYAFA